MLTCWAFRDNLMIPFRPWDDLPLSLVRQSQRQTADRTHGQSLGCANSCCCNENVPDIGFLVKSSLRVQTGIKLMTVQLGELLHIVDQLANRPCNESYMTWLCGSYCSKCNPRRNQGRQPAWKIGGPHSTNVINWVVHILSIQRTYLVLMLY